MKLSIVIPVFNVEKYLKQCIDSILNQNFKDFELILIDDCSTDSSLDICKLYKKNNRNINVFHLDKNMGVSFVRNKGIDIAKGEYITFVDSDDFVEQDIYSNSILEMEKNKADLVAFGYNEVHKFNKLRRKQRIPLGVIETNSIMDKIVDDGTLTGFLFPSVCLCIYNLSVIKKNNIKFDVEVFDNEDGLFNLKYCICSNKIYSIADKNYYNYRFIKKALTYEKYKVNVFDIVNKKILDIQSEYLKYNFINQIKKREITTALWKIINIVRLKDINFVRKIKMIKDICCSREVLDNINEIDIQKLNKYKKFFLNLIKSKNYKSLYFSIKYIMPLFQTIFVR